MVSASPGAKRRSVGEPSPSDPRTARAVAVVAWVSSGPPPQAPRQSASSGVKSAGEKKRGKRDGELLTGMRLQGRRGADARHREKFRRLAHRIPWLDPRAHRTPGDI
jgi:hypothetical protein